MQTIAVTGGSGKAGRATIAELLGAGYTVLTLDISAPAVRSCDFYKTDLNQLGETIEAMQLAKVSPDLDDLSAVFAVALLKLGMATGFVEQRHPGFAKEVEEKRQRVIAALTQKH